MDSDLILLAEIMGAHGLKGAVKLRFFGADIEALPTYPPLVLKDGRKLQVESVLPQGRIWVAQLAGINTRAAAEALFKEKLYLPRTALPKIEEKDTYYHSDLIGLRAVHIDGTDLGRVQNVVNFGAGDLLDIAPVKGASFYIPFTAAVVPAIDLSAGTLSVNPPPGLLE